MHCATSTVRNLGQDIIEYVLIAAFITTAVIATVTAVGKWVFNSWSNLNAQLT